MPRPRLHLRCFLHERAVMGPLPLHPAALIARQSTGSAYYPIITGTSKHRPRTRRYVCLVFQETSKRLGGLNLSAAAPSCLLAHFPFASPRPPSRPADANTVLLASIERNSWSAEDRVNVTSQSSSWAFEVPHGRSQLRRRLHRRFRR